MAPPKLRRSGTVPRIPSHGGGLLISIDSYAVRTVHLALGVYLRNPAEPEQASGRLAHLGIYANLRF